jgi:hypothetical protein
MREAVIVSTARTPIGRAYRGAFNNTEAARTIINDEADIMVGGGQGAASLFEIA